jgi:hypothetical protein
MHLKIKSWEVPVEWGGVVEAPSGCHGGVENFGDFFL